MSQLPLEMILIGTSLAHYEITGLLGKGGMGEVYRALDRRLGREVALKVLPEAFAEDAERLERFEREARTVAGLSHPNVVHLYSVEEAGGVHFLTMELVEGDSLDRLAAAGDLSPERLLAIGAGVADALAAAHAKGIVHRDLKPTNVMVDGDGRPKVLDFGLAKLAEEGAAQGVEPGEESATAALPLTGTGVVMGTMPYMSPEQLRGEAVDHRSDIFSLGVLLYELATGQRPFAGDSAVEVSSSILRDKPPPVTELRGELPRHLARILALCLEKEPQRRHQSALDVRNQLEGLRDEVRQGETASGSGSLVSSPEPATDRSRVAGRSRLRLGVGIALLAAVVVLALMIGRGRETAPGAVGSEPVAAETVNARSIAVLPFVNRSADPEQEYFSDGISEELLNLLARIPELAVTSRSSSFSFKGKQMKLTEIARELGVAHVLEGAVRQAGDRVRITAQLVDARSDRQLWSQSWDRTLGDVFAIQDEIAAAVLDGLRVKLLGAGPSVEATDPEAYALSLRARHLIRQNAVESLEQAEELYRKALALAPDYATAWVGLATVYNVQAGKAERPPKEGFRLAADAAERAIAIAPDYGSARSIRGQIALNQRDLAAAARDLQRALKLSPSDPEVLGACSKLSGALGRMDESVALDRLWVARDPLSARAQFSLGITLYFAGRYEEAIASCDTALALSPDQFVARLIRGLALLAIGQHDRAIESIEAEPLEPFRLTGLALAYHELGQAEASDAALAVLIENHAGDFANNVAFISAQRGEVDRAFSWLDKAVEAEDSGLSEILLIQEFAPLHDDPRWFPFLRSIGMAPEQVAAIPFEVTVPDR